MYSFWGELMGMVQSEHDEKKKIWPEKGRDHEPITRVTLGQVRRNY